MALFRCGGGSSGGIEVVSDSITIAGVTTTTSPLSFKPNKVFTYCDDGTNYQSCVIDTTNNIKIVGGYGGGFDINNNSDFITINADNSLTFKRITSTLNGKTLYYVAIKDN